MSHMKKSYLHIPPVQDIPFFDNLKKLTSTLNLEKLKTKLRLCHYSRGDIIYNYPEEREFVYIIKGTVALYLTEQNTIDNEQLDYKSQNQYFGEQQIVNHRTLTKAVAQLPTIVYKLTLSGMYQHLRAVFVFPQLEAKINYIKSLPYFFNINEQNLERTIQASIDLKPSINSIVYQQGEQITSLFVIMRGNFELSKKTESKFNHTTDVSIISAGQCLGLQEMYMRQVSQETVKCVSSDAWLIQLNKAEIKKCQLQCNRELIKSRSNWRKRRAEDNQNLAKKYKSLSTEQSKNFEDHHQSYEYFLQRKSSSKNSRYISNRPHQRPKSTYLTQKIQPVELNLLPQKVKRVVKTLSEQQIGNKTTSDMGQMFRDQFLMKKQRIQNNMLMRYLKTRPPQLVFNPQKQYAVMKSLVVKPSDAIKNRKKTLAILKHKYFKPFISFERIS